ncbi:MAG: hypothetical protein ACQERF_02230 [Actinomycetota bacterium]
MDREQTIDALAQVSAEISDAHTRLEAAVRAARAAGATWAQIGEATGVTRQAAHERWGHMPRAGCPRDGCDCEDHEVLAAACVCGHGPGRGHYRRRT